MHAQLCLNALLDDTAVKGRLWLRLRGALHFRLCGVFGGVAADEGGPGLPVLEPVGLQPRQLPEFLCVPIYSASCSMLATALRRETRPPTTDTCCLVQGSWGC